MYQYSSPAEVKLQAKLAEAVQGVMYRETERDAEKLQKKTNEYLHKASKSVTGGSRTWEKVVEAYFEKFFQIFWNAVGDRPWLDEMEFS